MSYERILSLDGGGTWALIQVRVLMDLFGAECSGHEVLRAFDLVVANSGGSVVAGALAVNKTLGETLDLFRSEAARRSVFQPTALQAMLPEALGHALPLPRYSTQAKYDGLRAAYGPAAEVRLSAWHEEGLPHLLLTAFDYDMTRGAFFRSHTASLAASELSEAPATATLLDAVHASANPPVLYFDAPTQLSAPGGRKRYWDGGVSGYNNPALVGVVEALANGADRSRIRVLALGTGTVRRPLRTPAEGPSDPRFMGGQAPSLVGDFKTLAAAILDDPPDAASFTAHVALGGAMPVGGKRVGQGPIVRMSPVVRPLRRGSDWTWSDALPVESWIRLTELELDATAQSDVDLIDSLSQAWMQHGTPNQPIRATADLQADIGHDTYPQAKAEVLRWLFRPQSSAEGDGVRLPPLGAGVPL